MFRWENLIYNIVGSYYIAPVGDWTHDHSATEASYWRMNGPMSSRVTLAFLNTGYITFSYHIVSYTCDLTLLKFKFLHKHDLSITVTVKYSNTNLFMFFEWATMHYFVNRYIDYENNDQPQDWEKVTSA